MKAVASGCNVAYSSNHMGICDNYRLDSSHPICPAWSPSRDRIGQWIEVSCENPKYWTGVIIQGGADNYWTSSTLIAYSLNGNNWSKINDGIPFVANNDAKTKKRINFPEAVYARTIRLYPITW